MSVEHDQLVNIAARWLANRCSVVVTELNTVSGEIPDAIGWHGPHSILIECKVTRCDFKSDAGKFFRRCPEYGMGLSRYFLMRDNQPIGCMPDQSSADLIAGIINRTNPGVTIELGELEKAELELKKRRMK